MKFIILVQLLLLSVTALSQQRVKVVDPDLEFSVEVPEGWETKNTDYYYYVIMPAKLGNANISITYVEEDTDIPLDDIVKFKIEHFFPLNVPEFKLVESGNDAVGNTVAKWVTYSSSSEGVDFKSIHYFYSENGHTFEVVGMATSSTFDKYLPKIKKVIKSIRSNLI